MRFGGEGEKLLTMRGDASSMQSLKRGGFSVVPPSLRFGGTPSK